MTGPQVDSERADQARDFLGEPFRLHSIVEVPAPEGTEGVWQQYVIVQGINTINGLRSGTRSEVSVQIESMVEHLNERFRKGKARLVGSPGRKTPAAAHRPPAEPRIEAASTAIRIPGEG
jgi:hypothetical protein